MMHLTIINIHLFDNISCISVSIRFLFIKWFSSFYGDIVTDITSKECLDTIEFPLVHCFLFLES